MNLARARWPSLAWYGLLMSTTSNQIGSWQLLPFSPKNTSSYTLPIVVHKFPGTTPWKVSRLGFN
jgi:hypothetical protein